MSSRVDAIRFEMRDAVRQIGEAEHVKRFGHKGAVKDHNTLAAKVLGITPSMAERLCWLKVRRVSADLADLVRETRDAIKGYIASEQAKQEALARHEISILAARLQLIESRLEAADADFHGGENIPALEQVRRTGFLAGPGPSAPTAGGEG